MDAKLPEDLSIYFSMNTKEPSAKNYELAVLPRDFIKMNEENKREIKFGG